MRDPWQEPVRGSYADPSLDSLDGLAQLRAQLTEGGPRPPITRLTGSRLLEVSSGKAVFELPLSGWLCASQGAISIGPLMIPADAAMACAIKTVLPPRTRFTTSELSLRMLSPAKPGGRLTARGRLIQARQRLALAEASLTDEDDRLIAHGSTLCLIQPQVVGPAPLDGGSAPAAPQDPDQTAPDPWQRVPRGAILPQRVWEQRSGLEVLSAQLQGELPAPPIHHLTGIALRNVCLHEATLELPASEWLCAPQGGHVQGGAVGLLAEAALSAAIQTTVPSAAALAPIDLKINYLRPLRADGRPATARGSVIHPGRRIAVANSEVVDADGKRIAVATGSAMLLPGRPASLGAVAE